MQPARTPAGNAPAFSLDSLESRTLLSASIHLSHGTVVALGDAKVANTITVGLSADKTQYVVTVTPAGSAAVTQSFAAGGVRRFLLEGGKKNDVITTDETNGPLLKNVVMLGHGGNDTLTGGAENDLILGGAGDDVISSGAGHDTVLGGLGNDSITTGVGSDLIFGGEGNDTVHAGGGNDTVFGLAGSDQIFLGTGGDIAYGGGTDSLTGGPGNDTFWVRSGGHDVVTGGGGNDTTHEASLRTLNRRREAAIDALHLEARLRFEV